MTTPTHAVSQAFLNGIRAGDDALLATGFREVYPDLVREAASELDDPGSASRIVERAVARVLATGKQATDAATLDRMLRSAVHEGAVREKSRLAALGRFEHNEGVEGHKAAKREAAAPDAAQAWERILKARDAATHSSASHAAMNEEGKHLAAAHMASAMDRKNPWIIPGIILGVLAVTGGVYISRLDMQPTDKMIMLALTGADSKPVATAEGQIGNVTLADSTAVRLGAGSKMRIAKDFSEPLRAISLNGAASFAVKPHKQPFDIRTNNLAIGIASGRIDVRGDSAKPTLVRVVEGQAVVRSADSSWTVAQGQSLVVTPTGTAHQATPQEIEESLGWLEGRFAASGTVRDVVTAMRRWYAADIGIGDASANDLPASATGSLESLSATAASLQKSAPVYTVWVGRQMVVYHKK